MSVARAGTEPPRPDGIASVADFVTGLRRLRRWSGLTYRQIAIQARGLGEELPASTLASILNRSSLPRRDVVATFVRVCALDEVSAARWIAVHDTLAEAANPLDGAGRPSTAPVALAAQETPDAGRGSRLAAGGSGPACGCERCPPGCWAEASSDPADGPPDHPRGWSAPAMLPPDISDFVGRQDHLHMLGRYLTGGASQSRQSTALPVVSVSGMAGVGKTTLVVHAAHQLVDSYPDGQLYANLGMGTSPLEPAEVLARFLRAIGVPSSAIPSDAVESSEMYRSRLAGRRVLVVLDNAASEEQVRSLLPGTATCAVLVTSRNRLTGLESVQRVDLDVFSPDEGIMLFGRIIGYERVISQIPEATEIVKLCGNLPLAVRIAGARLAARPAWQIAKLRTLLGDERRRLDQLSTGDLAPCASLALTYDGLDAETQRLFRLLSLFDVPDFPAWLATVVLGTPSEHATEHAEALVDAQLLSAADTDVAGQVRYRFHDLVRLFGRRHAEAHENAEQIADVLSRGFGGWLAIAEAMASRVPGPCYAAIGGSAPRPVIDWSDLQALLADPIRWFDAERPALLAAIRQACRLGLDELAFDLASRMEKYFDVRGMYTDWANTNLAVMALCQSTGNLLGEAVMLRGLIDVTTWTAGGNDEEVSATLFSKASRLLGMFTELGHQRGMSDAAVMLSWAQAAMGEPCQAIESASRGLSLAQESDHLGGQARAHVALAVANAERLDFSTGLAHLASALRHARALGNPRTEATVLQFAGIGHRELGDFEASRQALEASLAISQQHDDRYTESLTLLAMARLHLRRGDPRSRTVAVASLAIAREYAMAHHVADALELLGEIELADGRPTRAIPHLEESVSLWRTRGWLSFEGAALTSLGRAYLTVDARAAQAAFEKALALFVRLGNAARIDELSALIGTTKSQRIP